MVLLRVSLMSKQTNSFRKLQLEYVMPLDDYSSFLLTLKGVSYGAFSSTTFAVCGEIGCCSTISKMQCISGFHFSERQVPSTYLGGVCSHLPVSWLLRMVRLLCCWYWICDALELLFMKHEGYLWMFGLLFLLLPWFGYA